MSALTELLGLLRTAEDGLDQARGQLSRGRKSLSEAEAALADIDPEHPETVVPPGLRRADDELERTQQIVEQVADTLREFSTRL
ncbi:hypothetical protein [Parasphingorhabdus pacifica]